MDAEIRLSVLGRNGYHQGAGEGEAAGSREEGTGASITAAGRCFLPSLLGTCVIPGAPLKDKGLRLCGRCITPLSSGARVSTKSPSSKVQGVPLRGFGLGQESLQK